MACKASWRLCLAALVLCVPAFGQPGPTRDAFGGTGAVSAAPGDFDRRDITLSGSKLLLPVIASAETSAYGKLYTVLEIANITDSGADYSLRFLGADGTALSMPVQGSCPTCAAPASSRQATVGAHGGGRIVILPRNPLKLGWAEFTSDPDAALSVSATLYAEGTDGTVGRAGIPPASTYRRAWLYTDNTSDFTTRVILVNPSATEQRTYQLQFRDFSDTGSTCQASVQIAALGQALVETASSLTCSSADLGLLEISGDREFTGIAIVSHDGDGTIFTRPFFERPVEQYPLLERWTVASGTVTYGANTSAGCVAVSDTAIDGVAHTVHTSKWQKRADESSPWTDIASTGRTGMVCAYTPPATEAGQYRGVAEISIGGERGEYSTHNVLTVAPGATDSQPSFGAATVGNQSYQAGTAISPLTLPAASGGDGTLSYSLSPGVAGLSFNAATRVLAGTPTAAGTYALTYTVSDADGDLATLSFVVTVATAQMTAVDLVVASVTASDDTPGPGQSFDLTAATSNSGTAASAATTLRFYRSTNTTISSSDTQVGTAAVGALAAGGTGSSALTLTAPSTAGTYYYGACVDQVSGESDSQNNCSNSTAVTVRSLSTARMIPDANLRAAIEAALGKASGAPITAGEMGTLTQLRMEHSDVSDLTGLELAANLTSLVVWNNRVTDVSPLADLTRLTHLQLGGWYGGAAITNLSPLAGLTNLTNLNLYQSGITDVSPLAGLTNLTNLILDDNMITDISALSDLTNLGKLEVKGNILNDSSINDHIPVLESRGVSVGFHSLRKGDFDIDLVFLDDFTEAQKYVLRWAARRWMSVITDDLPDHEFAQVWSGRCAGLPIEIPAGERIDDLRIYVSSFEDHEGASGYGGPSLLRENHLPIVGCIALKSSIYNHRVVALHEMGHALGFARRIWGDLGFFQDADGDQHFNGPLAIAAFDDAGGRDYTGQKVPVEGSHWRSSEFPGELMRAGGGSALSAVTVQSLADLGYGVDLTQADAYAVTLPGVVATQSRAKEAAAAARAKHTAAIREDDRLRGSLASPTRAEPKLWCGLDGEQEPIHVVDQQGRIILTIDN